MSDSEVNTKAKLEKFLSNRKLSSAEYELQQLEREFAKGNHEPLDVTATLFYMYNPRFQGQLNFMSLKQLKILMVDLAGSEANKDSDVNKVLVLSKSINLKGLRRVITGVVESPLQEGELHLLGPQEKKLFELLDGLFTNKYYSCLKSAVEVKLEDNKVMNDLDEIIKHKINIQSKEFQKREQVEKDAFHTGSKVLACKYLMWHEMQKELAEKMVAEEGKNDAK